MDMIWKQNQSISVIISQNPTCYLCNGYYGPSFGEPVCVTCHEFLYPDIPHHLPNSYILSEKTDDGDSGNDEPSVGELMYNDRRLTRALQQQGIPNWAFRVSWHDIKMLKWYFYLIIFVIFNWLKWLIVAFCVICYFNHLFSIPKSFQ